MSWSTYLFLLSTFSEQTVRSKEPHHHTARRSIHSFDTWFKYDITHLLWPTPPDILVSSLNFPYVKRQHQDVAQTRLKGNTIRSFVSRPFDCINLSWRHTLFWKLKGNISSGRVRRVWWYTRNHLLVAALREVLILRNPTLHYTNGDCIYLNVLQFPNTRRTMKVCLLWRQICLWGKAINQVKLPIGAHKNYDVHPTFETSSKK